MDTYLLHHYPKVLLYQSSCRGLPHFFEGPILLLTLEQLHSHSTVVATLLLVVAALLLYLNYISISQEDEGLKSKNHHFYSLKWEYLIELTNQI